MKSLNLIRIAMNCERIRLHKLCIIYANYYRGIYNVCPIFFVSNRPYHKVHNIHISNTSLAFDRTRSVWRKTLMISFDLYYHYYHYQNMLATTILQVSTGFHSTRYDMLS